MTVNKASEWLIHNLGTVRCEIGHLFNFLVAAINEHIYMLFTGREVRIGKNCVRGLEYGPRPQAEGRTQDQGHSFSLYGPT